MAHYTIDTSLNPAAAGQNGINHFRAAVANTKRFVAIMTATLDGTSDYTKLEGAAAGLGILAGDGEAVYALYSSFLSSIEGVSPNFVDPIDQGT